MLVNIFDWTRVQHICRWFDSSALNLLTHCSVVFFCSFVLFCFRACTGESKVIETMTFDRMHILYCTRFRIRTQQKEAKNTTEISLVFFLSFISATIDKQTAKNYIWIYRNPLLTHKLSIVEPNQSSLPQILDHVNTKYEIRGSRERD